MNEQERMEFFYNIFDRSMLRLGPGDEKSTNKALEMVLSAGDYTRLDRLKVLDIGCGVGAQSIQLAKTADFRILAVDNHQPYLDELKRRAKEAGVAESIEVSCRDMKNLGLDESSFDLIWSEGALYIMGIREGIEECHRLLKPGGFLVVSDLVWFKQDPPKECSEYLANDCSFLTDLQGNLDIMKKSGYDVIGHFKLSESTWMKSYYLPLESRLQFFRGKYPDDKNKLELIEYLQQEIDLYRKYSSYYGYIFFVMQRD